MTPLKPRGLEPFLLPERLDCFLDEGALLDLPTRRTSLDTLGTDAVQCSDRGPRERDRQFDLALRCWHLVTLQKYVNTVFPF